MVQPQPTTEHIKGGSDEGTVFETVRKMRAQGKTTQEAINAVGFILRNPLPEHIKEMIFQQFGP